MAPTQSTLLMIVLGASIGALLFAVGLARWVLARSTGTPEMRKISDAIQEGAEAYLARQNKTIAMLAVLVAAVLAVGGLAAYLVDAIEGPVIGPTSLFGWAIPLAGVFVVLANAWMNAPTGFRLVDGRPVDIDPIAVEDIMKIVHDLKNRGIGVLVTDHNVHETLSITDRSYLLFEGRIIRAGSADELANDPEARRLYLGENFSM